MVDVANTKKHSLFKRIIINIIPIHILLLVRNELKLLCMRVASKLTIGSFLKKLGKFEKPYKVNVASGNYGKKGWINLDCVKNENITGIFDLRKKNPFT